jgi:hypothetical protein
MKKYNPKALNIDKLYLTDKRVTLGFKCSPQLKIELAEKAGMKNISLSEYVEGIVVNLPIRNNNLRKKVEELNHRLEYFEKNPVLINLLEKVYGQEHTIKTKDNKDYKIIINDINDVFDVMVNSFKSE